MNPETNTLMLELIRDTHERAKITQAFDMASLKPRTAGEGRRREKDGVCLRHASVKIKDEELQVVPRTLFLGQTGTYIALITAHSVDTYPRDRYAYFSLGWLCHEEDASPETAVWFERHASLAYTAEEEK